MGWMFDNVGRLIARLQKPATPLSAKAPCRRCCRSVCVRSCICRPVGLSEADCEKVCRYASERVGLGYDFKNVIDLMRYLFPWPLTQRWRRRTIALGSGDASRIICSSLIAQAFAAVRYPILPKIHARREPDGAARNRRDPSLVTLCATRLRYFPLLHGGEAHTRARLQL